jgi:hypothetical protein
MTQLTDLKEHSNKQLKEIKKTIQDITENSIKIEES